MADFDVGPAGEHSHQPSNLSVVNWDDPPSVSGQPSRLLARPGFPLRRYRTVVGQTVRLEAVVAGVQAPLDTALGGRLFSADLVEGAALPRWAAPPLGQSSVIRFRFDWCGHHTIAVRRTGGGAILVPIDVEVA